MPDSEVPVVHYCVYSNGDVVQSPQCAPIYNNAVLTEEFDGPQTDVTVSASIMATVVAMAALYVISQMSGKGK